MTEEQRLVYVQGMILQARIKLESMLVANKEREMRGESLAYGEAEIYGIIDECGIHHNALITNLVGP